MVSRHDGLREMCMKSSISRRAFVAGAAASITAGAAAQERDYRQGSNPVRFPDADIVVLDDRFKKYKLGNTAIQRLYTGCLWAEGIIWNAVGKYVMWSDIPSDVQMRWLWDDGHVSTFRSPSGNSNGNTYDWEGRQISCEHGNRRVVRYEHSGKLTVLADKWNGKPLNAPNDIVVHPDGGIWFTDPGYGTMMNYEGNKGTLEIKEAVYRIDAKSGKMDMVADQSEKPNGICFSPDYKRLYVADTGKPRDIQVWDVVDGTKLKNHRQFTNMAMSKQPVATREGSRLIGGDGGSDGIRCDVDGNVWSAAGWVGHGYDGVH